MKLNEIKNQTFGQPGISKEVTDWLELYGMHNKNYFVHPDGAIDLKWSAAIYPKIADDKVDDKWVNKCPKVIDKLPVKFGYVKHHFSIASNDLITLEGCPYHVDGSFSAVGNKRLTSFEFIPKHCGISCDLVGTAITSLEGISDHLLTMNMGMGTFTANLSHITSGGIGLILIPGLVKIGGHQGSMISKPFRIIKKYLGKPDQIFECQTELIEAGYEEYAKL